MLKQKEQKQNKVEGRVKEQSRKNAAQIDTAEGCEMV
jgi:hypothetical protein